MHILKTVMKKLLLNNFIFFVFSLLLLPNHVAAESAKNLVENGNKAFARGDYETSLENYNKAAEAEPDSAVVLFNKGDAFYKQENYAEALNLFEQAAENAREKNDRRMEAQSRYNMGNSSFRQAENLQQQDPETALADYKRSSEYFQSAAKLDPDFTDATYNLETSRIAAKKVEELIRRKKQEAQQQAQQKQDMAKDLQNLQKEQQEAADKSGELNRSQQQGIKDQAQEQTKKLAENQKSLTDRTRNTADKLEKLGQNKNPESSENKAGEHINKAVAKQEASEKNLQQNNLSKAQKEQQEASRELQKALAQLEEDQDKNKNKEKSGGQKKTAEQQSTQQQKKSAVLNSKLLPIIKSGKKTSNGLLQEIMARQHLKTLLMKK